MLSDKNEIAQEERFTNDYKWILGMMIYLIIIYIFLFDKVACVCLYDKAVYTAISIAIITIYTLSFYFIKKYTDIIVAVTSISAIIYLNFLVLFFGWDAHFQNWLISVCLLFLTVMYPYRYVLQYATIFITVDYIVLYFMTNLNASSYALPQFGIISWLNIILFFTSMLFILQIAKWNTTVDKANLESEISEKEDELYTDALTQVASRYKMEEIFSNINLTSPNKANFWIVFADLDDFKIINDTYGHNIGDEVLKVVANILKKNFRKSDVVVRWGGEEFLILVRSDQNYSKVISPAAMKIMLERIKKQIEFSHYIYKEEIIHTTITIGCVSSEDYDNVEAMIKAADDKMYQGKAQGKNVIIM